MVYWAVFGFLYILCNSVGEEAYWRVFQSVSWKATWTDFLISGCYALMYYLSFVFIVEGWIAQIMAPIIGFGVAFMLIKVRDTTDIIKCTSLRFGLAIGCFLVLIWFRLTDNATNTFVIKRKQPLIYAGWNIHNIFS